jgi:hypothetical protein
MTLAKRGLEPLQARGGDQTPDCLDAAKRRKHLGDDHLLVRIALDGRR